MNVPINLGTSGNRFQEVRLYDYVSVRSVTTEKRCSHVEVGVGVGVQGLTRMYIYVYI